MPKAEIPFAYGELVSVTGSAPHMLFWFKDYSGIIRGIRVDVSDPANPSASKEEIVIKRKTEGQTRKKKMPPVGQADTSVMK